MKISGSVVTVTGGAGLIGSFLCEHILTLAPAKLIIIDDLSKGVSPYFEKLKKHPLVDFRQGSLEQEDFTFKALHDAQILFHLASRAYGIGYGTDEQHHLTSFIHNQKISLNITSAISAHMPDLKHVLLTSSSCVYPDDGPDTVYIENPCGDNPEMANFGYGVAKQALELNGRVIKYARPDLLVTTVRPFNIYGEYYLWAGKHSQAIPMLVKRIMEIKPGQPITVWGSGQQQRSYVHALDCARLMVALVEADYDEKPVNIGTEEIISITELTQLICRLCGKDNALFFDLSKPEGRKVKSADMSLVRHVLPQFQLTTISLEEGLKRMIERWYSQTFKAKALAPENPSRVAHLLLQSLTEVEPLPSLPVQNRQPGEDSGERHPLSPT